LVTLFVTELRDKIQSALLFSTNQHSSKRGALRFLNGRCSPLHRCTGWRAPLYYIQPRMLKLSAGMGFVTIGI
jgi:hypothetical protein